MITIRKLLTLADGTRRRKTLVLVNEFENAAAAGHEMDISYLRNLLMAVDEDAAWDDTIHLAARILAERLSAGELDGAASLRRELNLLGRTMSDALGRDWADWNAAMPGDDSDIADARPMRVYLDGIRSPFNVGSILRTALAFGAERLWAAPESASPNHRRAERSSMGASSRVPWEQKTFDDLSPDETGTVFALELGGISVEDFVFPASGTVILGSEELGVSPQLLKKAEAGAGVVSIPLAGAKASLNVGVAFGILMERWVSAIEKPER